MKKVLTFLLISILSFPVLFFAPTVLADQPQAWGNIKVADLNGSYQSTTDIAYGHGRFGIVYSDYRNGNSDIYLSLLKPNGDKIGDDINVSNDTGDSMEPTIVWNGRNFGIFWWEHWNVRYAAVSSNGDLLVSPKLVYGGVHISAVWNDQTDEYGVTWWGDIGGESIPGALFTRMDREGNMLSPVIALNSVIETDYYKPRIATSGEDYGITWSDWRGVTSSVTVFTVVNSAGEKVVNDQAVTTTIDAPWSIVWNGYEYAIINSSRLLLRINNAGDILSSSLLPSSFTLDHAEYLGLVWDGDQYIMSMKSVELATPTSADIFIAKFDRFGNTVSELTKISQSPNHDYFPSDPVIINNGSVAVSWIGNLNLIDQNITFAQSK